MSVMLADSIDGGIFAFLVLLCGAGASVLALIGLVPARQGNRAITLLMVSPAILAVITITVWLGYGFFTVDRQSDPYPESMLSNLIAGWVLLAGLPFFTSGTTLLVLWVRRRKSKEPSV